MRPHVHESKSVAEGMVAGMHRLQSGYGCEGLQRTEFAVAAVFRDSSSDSLKGSWRNKQRLCVQSMRKSLAVWMLLLTS
jgi:hypothetical protein